ncbi:chromate transporter [bacterium]|nr:chromate transporter [bacterium]
MSLIRLFLIFTKIGAILLGGGYVILPIMTEELCKKRKLVTYDELTNLFAISQSLPGIIAANMSMFVGYKLRRKSGAVAAIAGVTFIPFWTIVILASCISVFVNNSYVKGAFWGIDIAVIALILLTSRELWQNSKRNLFFCFIFIASLVALLIFKLSPIQVILIFTVVGIIFKTLEVKRK